MKKHEQAKQEAEKAAQAAKAASSVQQNEGSNNTHDEGVNAVQTKSEGKVRPQKGFNLFGFLFGGIFFMTSSAGLFLLFKFRKNFTR